MACVGYQLCRSNGPNQGQRTIIRNERCVVTRKLVYFGRKVDSRNPAMVARYCLRKLILDGLSGGRDNIQSGAQKNVQGA